MAKLFDVIENTKRSAAMIPTVKFVKTGDITELNKHQDIGYPAVIISQDEHYYDLSNDLQTYRLNIFAADLLTDDASNEIAVQSWAIDTLQIITQSIEDFNIGQVNYKVPMRTFTERFDSLAAGAWMSLEITTDDTSNCCS